MTTIEWTRSPDGTEGKTWNVVSGCTPISIGCKNCFAKRMAKRLAGRFGYPEAPHEFDVTLHEDKLDQPLRWKKPRMIFVVSMGDLFHEDVPFDYILRVWRIIHLAHQHTFQVLTKRPERMKLFLTEWMPGAWELAFFERPLGPFSNLWLGISAENQEMADKRIPLLLQTPAAVHFVSLEPLLGPIDLCRPWGQGIGELMIDSLDQVIVGGESGPGARPMHPDWARDIRDQCQEAGTPYFFKQWGAWALKGSCDRSGIKIGCSDFGVLDPEGQWFEGTTGWNGRPEDPDTGEAYMIRVGKKRAGRLLDGREWNEMPKVAP